MLLALIPVGILVGPHVVLLRALDSQEGRCADEVLVALGAPIDDGRAVLETTVAADGRRFDAVHDFRMSHGFLGYPLDV